MPGSTFTRPLQVALFFIAVVALVVVSPIGATMLSPALALVAVIWLGLFTGERPIAWARRVMRRRRSRRRNPVIAAPTVAVRTVLAGVALAFALAMRPPPHRGPSL